jgi:hypothetical protein
VEGGILICLYGEMRDALWPDHGLSGSMARGAFGVTLLPACYGAREGVRSLRHAPAPRRCGSRKCWSCRPPMCRP